VEVSLHVRLSAELMPELVGVGAQPQPLFFANADGQKKQSTKMTHEKYGYDPYGIQAMSQGTLKVCFIFIGMCKCCGSGMRKQNDFFSF
jgi:hypothetical protein